jgi:transcriptional regulator with XRE-family HTH domain
MNQFRPAKKRTGVSAGESVRIVRELQGHSQNRLAELRGTPRATLSTIENNRIRLVVERGRVLARALRSTQPFWSCLAGVAPLERWHDTRLGYLRQVAGDDGEISD